MRANDLYLGADSPGSTYLAHEGGVAPERSTVEVARLPKDALVEIDVIALR
jgi:enamine deaminase RidA (YjgF/YER057c/UK114 family)